MEPCKSDSEMASLVMGLRWRKINKLNDVNKHRGGIK